jgi:hypothetical protein
MNLKIPKAGFSTAMTLNPASFKTFKYLSILDLSPTPTKTEAASSVSLCFKNSQSK